MFDSDNWQEIYSSLKKSKLRTFFTAFGVFWGIFMLIIMLGSGNGLENGVIAKFGGSATNSIFIWTNRTTVAYAGLPKGRNFNMRNEDIVAIEQEVEGLESIAPRNQLRGYGSGNNVSHRNKSGSFTVMGDYPQVSEINPMEILKGRFLNKLDIAEKRKVVVIGTNVRDVLFGKGDPVNENIKINGVFFKVIGVWKSKKSGGNGREATQTLFIPFTTFQKAFNYGNVVGLIAATAKPNSDATVIEEKIKSVLKKRHKVSPNDERAFGSYNAKKEYEKFQDLFNGIAMLIWVVGSGTLIAGIIGVSNIMLIVVKERTKEIGIRRAIGATPITIVGQIMMEAITLTSISGYFGLVFGVAFTEVVSSFVGDGGGDSMYVNPTIDLKIALTALTILIISGAFAGLIPAIKAIKIKPIDALRAE